MVIFKQKFAKLEKALHERYSNERDPWGLEPKRAMNDLKAIWPLYKYYFDVRLHGRGNVQEKPYMVVSNHTGQIPIDGLMICTAFATDLAKPRVLRPLIERYMTALPFIGRWSSESGAVLGDRANCLNLLKRGESILVFPEGVRGISKETKDYYKLQRFTKGFIRMALTAKVEILPIAVVGAEEFYPFVFHLKKIAKFLSLPALPLSLNLIPLPSPVDIYIGEPYVLPEELSAEALDEELEPHIIALEKRIDSMIKEGLEKKRTISQRLKKL